MVIGLYGPVGLDVLLVVEVVKGQERNRAPIQRLRMAVKHVEAVDERNKHAAQTTVQVRYTYMYTVKQTAIVFLSAFITDTAFFICNCYVIDFQSNFISYT